MKKNDTGSLRPGLPPSPAVEDEELLETLFGPAAEDEDAEEPEARQEDARLTDAAIMAQMLAAFRPAAGMDVADAMMTTEELARTMEGTFRPDRNELARLLWRLGYRTAFTGGRFRWLMRRAGGGADITVLP